MLDMIKNKMKGNLSEAEDSFLERTISELKLNYMAEINKKPSEEQADNPESNSGDDESAGTAESDEQKIEE